MKDLSWETKSSTYLLKADWCTIRRDTCESRDGKIIDPYYVYEFPDWVCAVAMTQEGKVIIERQYRHAEGSTHYELPGGCIDHADSSPEKAVARELLEETGYEFVNITNIGKISANPSTNNNHMHMFLATGGRLVAEQHLDHNEEIEVYLFSIDDVKKLMKEHKITQSMHITTLLYALERLGELTY